MDELYLAVYEQQGADQLRPLVDDCLANPSLLPEMPAEVRLAAGSGERYLPALREKLPALDWWPDAVARAATIARLAVPVFRDGGAVAAEKAQPVYLRDRVIQGAVR